MWRDVSTLVGGLSCVGLLVSISPPPPNQRVFQRSRHICTDPGCCSSVPSQALSFPGGCGAPVLFLGIKRTCGLLCKGDGHNLDFSKSILSLFLFKLCCFCTWLEFAHFFSMPIFIFAHVVPMQNDKTGACECVYYIFYRYCVFMQRAACSVTGCLFERARSGIGFLWAGKRTHTRAHWVGGVFLAFLIKISFCSIFPTTIYSHHKSSTDSGNPWLMSVV